MEVPLRTKNLRFEGFEEERAYPVFGDSSGTALERANGEWVA
jgi:hypothetical protein